MSGHYLVQVQTNVTFGKKRPDQQVILDVLCVDQTPGYVEAENFLQWELRSPLGDVLKCLICRSKQSEMTCKKIVVIER